MRPWFGWDAARAAWRDRTARQASGEQTVIFYDGECAMCQGIVRLLLRVGVPPRYYFASQQGTQWAALLASHPALSTVDSIVISRGSAGDVPAWVKIRAEAVLWLLTQLRMPFAMAVVFFAVPMPVLDLGYRLVARYRKRILGTVPEGACPVPPAEYRDRFLD